MREWAGRRGAASCERLVIGVRVRVRVSTSAPHGSKAAREPDPAAPLAWLRRSCRSCACDLSCMPGSKGLCMWKTRRLRPRLAVALRPEQRGFSQRQITRLSTARQELLVGLFWSGCVGCVGSNKLTFQAAPGSSQPRPIRRLGWACAKVRAGSRRIGFRRKTNSKTRHPI
eukprot:scaffold67674_cov63-Phaeocystis_antarctica.AAC.1